MDWERLLEVFNRPLFSLGETPVSLALCFQFVLIVLGVIWGSAIFRRLLRDRILVRTGLDRGLQDALARIAGYAALALGLLVGLNTIGIELTSLTVLAGALGVGIGFGLQNIVNNFVSGLIILTERPIRVGDRVEVKGTVGEVVTIGARSTTVVTNDNIAIIIPNSEFISERVINWTHHGDARVRLRIPVGVAYGSEPREVERILLEVALANPNVLRDPPPKIVLRAFGESSLDFEMRVWTLELHDRPGVLQSEIYFAVWDALKAAAIEIPYPQREIHVRAPLRVEISQPGQSDPARSD